MSDNDIREPIQKRSIEKKEKIIQYGFNLICEKGYYNTNTAEIAKAAGVSTGIVYNYFKDKHDILLEGIKLYANDIFCPMINLSNFDKNTLEHYLKEMIDSFIENHKLSESAHEEIMAMIHSDKDVAQLYHLHEIDITEIFTNLLLDNGFDSPNLKEKAHVALGLIDNLCHEIIYHKHDNMDYENMKKIVINTVINLLS